MDQITIKTLVDGCQMDDMSSEIKERVHKLSQLMKRQPELTDHSLIREGQRGLAIFIDANYGFTTPQYRETLIKMFTEAIIDLSNGATLLYSHCMGVSFKNGKLFRFTVPNSEPNVGSDVVCSLRLKSLKAFETHKTDQLIELDQNHINAAIYLLIYRISKL